LEGAGHSVVMKDGLRTMSRTLDWLLVQGYASQIKNTPRSLRASFAVASRRVGAAAVRAVVGLLFANRLLEAVREERPDLVVSTHPLVIAALGRLRRSGELRLPAAVIADHGVHALWVTPRVDLHLVVSRRSAELAGRAGGRASLVRLPVAPGFCSAPKREEARAALGLPREAFVALVLGGVWGIGDLEGAARCAAESGACTAVVAGTNDELKTRLEEELGARENVRVLGWRKDVPVLMAASGRLIRNAGGTTCVEAVETGLSILVFDPILGHGELNARVMEQAGAARWVRTSEDLQALLRYLARREVTLRAPNREPSAPTTSTFLESLTVSDARSTPARRIGRPRLVLAGAAAVLFCLWLAFSSSGMALAEKGFRLHVPGYDPPPGEISPGVKATDPKTAAVEGLVEKEKLPVATFSDAQGAEGLYPIAGLTVGVAEKPSDEQLSSPWSDGTEARNAASGVQHATGEYPRYFVPAPRANLAALADAPPRTRLVMPEEAGKAGPRPGLLVVETSGLAPEAVQPRLDRKLRKIRHEGLCCVPLAQF
jgi:UDP-N-acetylglucosamine:LPS N-acetylglucosamine transferase